MPDPGVGDPNGGPTGELGRDRGSRAGSRRRIRARRHQAVGAGRGRRARHLRHRPCRVLRSAGEPLRLLRLFRPHAVRRLRRPASDSGRLLPGLVRHRHRVRDDRDRRVDPRGVGRRRHGGGRLRRPLRGDRGAAGGERFYGGTLDLRASGGGRRPGRRDRPTDRRVRPGRGRLDPRVPADLAGPLARPVAPSAVGHPLRGGRVATAHVKGDCEQSAKTTMDTEVAELRTSFAATPYPPTGASLTAMALAKLVGRTEWVAENAVLEERDADDVDRPSVRRILGGVADTLQSSARLVRDGRVAENGATPVDEEVRASTLRLDVNWSTTSSTPRCRGCSRPVSDSTWTGRRAGRRNRRQHRDPARSGLPRTRPRDRHLDGGGHGARDRRGGSRPAHSSQPMGAAQRGHSASRGSGATSPSESVWFRNSVRGAAGLALAVAVAEATNVEHAFWVVLGTLAVLRSNALGTGSTALRAIGGTAVGFVIGSALLVGIGSHSVALWVLLPIAVLVSGMAPSMISFAAGQAGFTVMVVILFNIIQPSGWRVGLTRIEDVAIGCAVSVVGRVALLASGRDRRTRPCTGRRLRCQLRVPLGRSGHGWSLRTAGRTPARRSEPPIAPICASTTRSASSSVSEAPRWCPSRR